MTKTVDIYNRLSSITQEKGLSKETQEEKCREYCTKHCYQVRNIYYENCSAMKAHKRPVFAKMIAEQYKNKADMIIAFSLNRLTRNPYDFEDLNVQNHTIDFEKPCVTWV